MSTVTVQPFNIGGSSGPGKNTGQFSDNFTRANNGTWGPNWIQNAVLSGGSAGATMQDQLNANKGRIIQTNAGSANTAFTPTPLLWMLAQPAPRNHFCQFTFSAQSTTTMDLHTACVFSLDVFNSNIGFYSLRKTGAGGLNIIRGLFSGNLGSAYAPTVLSTLSGATATTGDVMRLEARISAGVWTLAAFKNGTSLGSTTDGTFNNVGVPAVFAELATNGANIDITSFSAGLL